MTDPKDWPKNRELWIAALRDPKRRQIKGKLGHQDHGGQCCLGVLAEVAGCRFWLEEQDGVEVPFWSYSSDLAPTRARDFVGLRKSDGLYGLSSLSSNNDSGKTFAEIADTIESEPVGLFREAI